MAHARRAVDLTFRKHAPGQGQPRTPRLGWPFQPKTGEAQAVRRLRPAPRRARSSGEPENRAAFDEQVATGALVIREMSASRKRRKWEARVKARTETEAVSKAAALEHRRRFASAGA